MLLYLTFISADLLSNSIQNIELRFEDLPTGQLAEATLTHFDANGLPIGGTITIDDDANDLGWFIDETPWENSEFRLPETETLLRTTPGSAAYGRYDLLTTILHELGHLAGIIHGNPAYDDRIQYINGSPTFIGNGYSAQHVGWVPRSRTQQSQSRPLAPVGFHGVTPNLRDIRFAP